MYAPSELEKLVTVQTLRKMKANGEKFITVALYDAPMAAMAQKTGVETVLVGDSLGMTVLGYDSTVPVTMEQMIYHVEAVARGNKKSLIMGDMPFMTYATPEQALTNATRIMQAGAHMVKIEGGAWLADTVKMLTDRGIPVCAHLGLTPSPFISSAATGFRGATKNTPSKCWKMRSCWIRPVPTFWCWNVYPALWPSALPSPYLCRLSASARGAIPMPRF